MNKILPTFDKDNLILDEKLHDMTYEEIEKNIIKMRKWLREYDGEF